MAEAWPTIDLVGFVDESGNMTDGEPHVVAGLLFQSTDLGRARSIAGQLLKVTDPITTKGGKVRYGKAAGLRPEGDDIYVDALGKVRCHWFKMTKDHLNEGRDVVTASMQSVAEAFRFAKNELAGADRLDLSPGQLITAFEEEATRHPIYTFLAARWIQFVAQSYRSQKCRPSVKLCFDDKFQRRNSDVLALLCRFYFMTELAESGRPSFEQLFGLVPCHEFRAAIDSDEHESALFLADIYAHACGRVAKNLDSNGRYASFLKRIEDICLE